MVGTEWIAVGVVALVLLFGAKKLPELARSLGQGIKEFRKGMREATKEEEEPKEKETTETEEKLAEEKKE